jgi:lysophospholipase L1-like esterase
MKILKKSGYILALLFVLCCEQDVIDLKQPPPPPPPPLCDDVTTGTADFTKFVALGSSYTAGFQAGALFDNGQNNSLAKILADQFSCAGGGPFNQPSIASENGYNIFVTPNPIINGPTITTLGRFKLQGTPPKPTPVLAGNEAIPNPALNPGFAYGGVKSELNNFAVQATVLAQILSPATGNWGNPNPAVGFSPFYARFASATGTSTILSDALAANGSFYMFWSGMDDYLLYAAFGGDPAKAPLTPVEGGVGVGFANTYAYIASLIFGANAEREGVIATFPSVFALPHFTSVVYNPVPMVEAQVAAANAGFGGYNQILEALKGPPFNYPAELVNARKISFAVGNNPFVIIDETLNDYGDEFDMLKGAGAITPEQREALAPYEQVRQTTATDIIPLATGGVLGTLADPANPATVRGIAVPLADQYALIPTEITAIETARAGYNAAIRATAETYSTQVALADVDAAFATFLTNRAAVSNGITITPNINPPTGIYSEDGMHPNTRGYAFIANIFIDAINAKFGSTLLKADLSKYGATALPINP